MSGMDGAWMHDDDGGRDGAGFGLRWDVICGLKVVAIIVRLRFEAWIVLMDRWKGRKGIDDL